MLVYIAIALIAVCIISYVSKRSDKSHEEEHIAEDIHPELNERSVNNDTITLKRDTVNNNMMQKPDSSIAPKDTGILQDAAMGISGNQTSIDAPANANEHKYVDLGLPSGTLWATCNVGAENEWDPGIYFMWGDTQLRPNTCWETYKFYNPSTRQLTKYSSGADSYTQLLPQDDAATKNWGNGWKTPTMVQLAELYKCCKWTWTAIHGCNGYLITGRNGNNIFLPAAGHHNDRTFYSYNENGHYWSSSLTLSDKARADVLRFEASQIQTQYYVLKWCALSVRPVVSK